MLDAKIAAALKKIIMNPTSRRKVSLEEQEAQMGRPISHRQTDCVHDLRVLSDNWCSWKLFLIILINSVLLFMETIFRILITDGIQFYFQQVKFVLDEKTSLDDIKTVLAMYEREIDQDLSKSSYQKLKTMVKRTHRSKDQDTKLSSQKRKN